MKRTLAICTVNKRGKVTIPIKMRRELDLLPGDRVSVSMDGDQAVITFDRSQRPVTIQSETHAV